MAICEHNCSEAILPGRRRIVSCAILVALLTFLLFMPVLRHGFVHWDDHQALSENHDWTPPRAALLDRIWLHPSHGYNGFYVPVTYTIWWATAHIAQRPAAFGNATVLDPMPFHALNLIFHALAAMLVFLILRRLVRSDIPAMIGALLFALHPLQAEPVSWASSMYTPLSGMLALAAMWAYLLASENIDMPRRQWSWYALASLCFVLGLLSKPTVVMLPVLVAVIEIVLRGRAWKQCWPLAVWLVLAGIDAIITRENHGGEFAFRPPLWMRPLVATDAVTFYLWKLLLPIHLVTDYGRSPQSVIQHASIYMIWIVPLAILLAAWRFRRTAKSPLAAVLLFMLAPLPTLGLAPFTFQHYSTVADRYAYLAMLGPALAAAFAARRWLTRLTDSGRQHQGRGWRPAAIGAATVILLLGCMTRFQTRYWRDTESLFRHNLAVNPQSLAANISLGAHLLARGTPDAVREAIDCDLVALAAHPDDPSANASVGGWLLRVGRPADALPYFRTAVELAPHTAYTHYMLARSLEAVHDARGAISEYALTLHLMPGYFDADVRLGDLLAQSGNITGAAVRYQIFLREHPNAVAVRDRLEHLPSQQPHAGVSD